nr:hypothetical protein [uncultured Desulfobacter sp.]
MNSYLKPNKLIGAVVLLGVLSLIFFVGGCGQKKEPQPPVNAEINQAINVLYKQAGQAASVEKQTILGKHFQPQANSWKVVACTNLLLTNGTNHTDCNDSFELYPLDTGKWIISGNINGTYRWLEVQHK